VHPATPPNKHVHAALFATLASASHPHARFATLHPARKPKDRPAMPTLMHDRIENTRLPWSQWSHGVRPTDRHTSSPDERGT